MQFQSFQGILGVFTIFFICWILSENRKKVQFKSIFLGFLTQVLLAVLILKFPPIQTAFYYIGQAVMGLKEATIAGTSFVFGYLGGSPVPFVENHNHTGNLFIFAFQALPMVIVISALAMLLFHWRILPFLVRTLSLFFRKFLSIGGALGVCSAAKIFLGQTEAPLLVRPYLKTMSRGEIFSIMTLGLATTSGTILAIYATILDPVLPNALTHILTASIISVPAAITLSRILIPHPDKEIGGDMVMPYTFSSSMDAISKGTGDGLKLFLNIIAMLIVFIAFVTLINKALGLIPFFDSPLTLQKILGAIMAPLTWLMGVPWSEATAAGGLLGIKTILNEMYAFLEFSTTVGTNLSPQTRVIITYALCGFANFASIGIIFSFTFIIASTISPLLNVYCI